MSTTIKELLQLFGAVTVMDIHVYKIKEGSKYGTNTLNKNFFVNTGLCLDTLKITNIKQNAAKKQFPVGLFNIPLIRTGKTFSIDIQDALGRIETLQHFCGGKIDSSEQIFSFSNDFAAPLCLEGTTWVVDLNGNKKQLWITIPCFFPKSVFNLNLQADGEAGVFDLSGDVYPVVWNEGEGLQHIILSTSPLVGVWEQKNE